MQNTQSKTLQRMTYAFGIFMAFLMVSSMILPALTQNSSSTVDDAVGTPTVTPAPIPDPIDNPEAITLTQDYLHPSSLFTVGVPEGWTVSTTINDSSRAYVNMDNSDVLTTIVTGLEQPATEVLTVADLNTYFNEARLQQAWGTNYQGWTELGRPSTDTELIVNFRLLDRQSRDYLARMVASIDDGMIRLTRVAVPDNGNQDAMVILSNLVQGSIRTTEQFAESQFGLTSNYDQINQWVMRYPRTWSKLGGSVGQTTTFGGTNDITVTVNVLQNTSVDESAAQGYVENLYPTAEMLTVAPIERVGGTGYSVTFSTQNFDGESVSGAVQLLNGSTGALYVVTALVPNASVDLNDEAASGLYADVLQALDSFSLITGLNLPELPATATPTPFPTVVPESTPEGTPEVEATDDAEATEEAE